MERTNTRWKSKGKKATMLAARQQVSELRTLVSDERWIGSKDETEKIQGHINGLVLEILGLALRPASGGLPIEYRLARAEAERLHGSCIDFERALNIASATEPLSETATEELKYAGDRLFVAAGAFLAMVEDVQD